MKRDSRLSGVLHVLLHMAEAGTPMTSEALAKMMKTNPVVIRRVLAGLREHELVCSEKGHGGGWKLCRNLESITLHDIYLALDEPTLLAMGNRTEAPGCLVEEAVNKALNQAFQDAEALLLARFRTVTLAQLSNDFHQRMQARGFSGTHDHSIFPDEQSS
ncbi:MAG TPA: Rrf2 family transcriptional regulator [Cellvibrio sp.]